MFLSEASQTNRCRCVATEANEFVLMTSSIHVDVWPAKLSFLLDFGELTDQLAWASTRISLSNRGGQITTTDLSHSGEHETLSDCKRMLGQPARQSFTHQIGSG